MTSTPRRLPRLHAAALQGDRAKIKLYLEHGVDINKREEEWGLTPLGLVVKEGKDDDVKTVDYLLREGADPSIGSKEARLPLFEAALRNKLTVAKALLEGGAVVDAGNEPCMVTALMAAASVGHSSMVKLLMDAGCDVSNRSLDGSTAAGVALRREHVDIVLELIDAGVDINEKDELDAPRSSSKRWI